MTDKTTDLVTELRQMAATGYAGCAIWAEAADEIEGLQNLLGEWLRWFGSTNDLSARTRRALDVSDDGKCWIKGCQQPKGHAGFCDPLPDPRSVPTTKGD